MTVLRTVLLFATLVLAAGALAPLAGCTSGTTPECDDAGSCLILANPSDAAPSTGEGGGEGGAGDGGPKPGDAGAGG